MLGRISRAVLASNKRYERRCGSESSEVRASLCPQSQNLYVNHS